MVEIGLVQHENIEEVEHSQSEDTTIAAPTLQVGSIMRQEVVESVSPLHNSIEEVTQTSTAATLTSKMTNRVTLSNMLTMLKLVLLSSQ